MCSNLILLYMIMRNILIRSMYSNVVVVIAIIIFTLAAITAYKLEV